MTEANDLELNTNKINDTKINLEKNTEKYIPLSKGKMFGVIMAITALIIWAGNFIVSRGLGGMYSPYVTSFFRWLLAVLFFLPFVYPKVKAEWKYIMEQKLLIGACGLIGISVFSLLVYVAGETTSATNMSLIVASSPVFSLLFLRIFCKEKISFKKIIGMIITMIGIAALLLKGDFQSLLTMNFVTGDYLMLICAFTWGGYMVVSKYKSPKISNSTFVFCGFALALIMNTPIFITHVHFTGFPHIEMTGILCFLYISTLNSILAFILWSKATDILGPSNVALIYNLIPVFSCILAVIILKEPIHIIQIVSMVIVISGIIISQDNVLSLKNNYKSRK